MGAAWMSQLLKLPASDTCRVAGAWKDVPLPGSIRGRAEVQVYAVARGQRAAVRDRLPQGVHLPHPDITQTSGKRVEVLVDRLVALELDGVTAPAAHRVVVEVVPEAFLIVI